MNINVNNLTKIGVFLLNVIIREVVLLNVQRKQCVAIIKNPKSIE